METYDKLAKEKTAENDELTQRIAQLETQLKAIADGAEEQIVKESQQKDEEIRLLKVQLDGAGQHESRVYELESKIEELQTTVLPFFFLIHTLLTNHLIDCCACRQTQNGKS